MEKDFCPLTGHISYRINAHGSDDLYINAIERARRLWNKDNVELRHPDGYVMASMCFTSKDIERCKRLFSAWKELRDSSRFTLELISSVDEHIRPTYTEEVMQKFKIKTGGIENFSLVEVLSVIIIYEAMKSLEQLQEKGRGDTLPLELLKILEDYNPHTLRGKKVIAGARASGTGRAIQIRDDHGEAWKDWQNRANNIWERNPCLSKLETAKKIRKTLQGETDYFSSIPSVSTIRQRIKKS